MTLLFLVDGHVADLLTLRVGAFGRDRPRLSILRDDIRTGLNDLSNLLSSEFNGVGVDAFGLRSGTSLLPALRATRVHPLVALREQ